MNWVDALVLLTLAVAFWGGYRAGVVRELAVTPRSQRDEQEKYRHDVCSPPSRPTRKY